MEFSDITWSDYRVATVIYKTVDDHSIKADILFPPGLQPGRHPLLLAIHGGYLITGARDYYRSISAWVPAYSASTSAIVVSPDYRLFPGAKTSDILSDLEDFWQWVQNDLPLVLNDLAPEYSIDLDKVLVHGTSAGGFCAAHIAMDHPESIRAAIMTYPMLDCLDAYMTEGPPSDIAATAPYQGQDLREKIEAARTEGWVSGRRDEESLLLTRSIMKQGYFGQLFGTDKRWNPLQKLQYTKGCLPRTWILQGKDDSGVPARGAIYFEQEARNLNPSVDLVLDIIISESSEHGFDRTWTMKDEKLTKRLDWINQAWLS